MWPKSGQTVPRSIIAAKLGHGCMLAVSRLRAQAACVSLRCCTCMQSNISGPIVLCSRSDGDPARFFDGSVAQLGDARPAVGLCCMAVRLRKVTFCQHSSLWKELRTVT